MKYYYEENKKEKGPISIDELKNLNLKRNTLVWREGLAKWQNAEEIEELSHLFKETPPPIPISKSEKVKEIISAEGEAIFKLFLLALGLTFIFYLAILKAYEPPYLSDQELKDMNEYLKNRDSEVVGQYGRWLGQSRYDEGIQVGSLPYINEIRKKRYLEDVNSTSIGAFFILFTVLLVGRYILKNSN